MGLIRYNAFYKAWSYDGTEYSNGITDKCNNIGDTELSLKVLKVAYHPNVLDKFCGYQWIRTMKIGSLYRF
jgi:hypothetical protein